MKIIMVTQAGCVKCDAAKKRLGTKLERIEVVDINSYPQYVSKYGLAGHSTPCFILLNEADGFFDVYDSVLYIEKYLLEFQCISHQTK